MSNAAIRCRRWSAIGGVLLISLIAVPLWADDFQWSGAVAPGQTFEVRGVNGSIAVEPASGALVELVARKTGRRDDPASVSIEVVEHAGGVTVCAVYPSTGSGENRCAPRGEGRMNVRDNDVQVDFEVRLPAGVDLLARTVNGSVKAEGLGARVDISTVNGSVVVATEGLAQAKTVNGSVTARVGRADWEGALAFSAVNGAVTVHLPDDVSASVRAKTVNGSISTDFPLTVQGRVDRRRLDGTIGAGGRTLDLKTVNGSIRLKRL
ncbi:MAG: DUF4097 family beta strand repeat protein [Acidobacteria bacterium]|nr:DUF4097 family beta strand repeat protein [Acidobacteriota bacterium]